MRTGKRLLLGVRWVGCQAFVGRLRERINPRCTGADLTLPIAPLVTIKGTLHDTFHCPDASREAPTVQQRHPMPDGGVGDLGRGPRLARITALVYPNRRPVFGILRSRPAHHAPRWGRDGWHRRRQPRGYKAHARPIETVVDAAMALQRR